MVIFQNNVNVVLSTINYLLGSFYYECTLLSRLAFIFQNIILSILWSSSSRWVINMLIPQLWIRLIWGIGLWHSPFKQFKAWKVESLTKHIMNVTHIYQALECSATSCVYTKDGATIDITSVVALPPVYSFIFPSHIVKAFSKVMHLYVIFTCTCVPFLQILHIIWFQLFKSFQPNFATMCFHKMTIKV
jgi:hypothetical protein